MTKKKAYINGIGCISPQNTHDNRMFLAEPVALEGNRLKNIEPVYKEYVPAEMVRRMGRIIKMGVAAAKISLTDAGCEVPERIITGTGLGCIEDTEKFLGNMIRNKEELLTPTSFIQSTHNTFSAQIALLLKCHGYNLTYVHRGFSFESAIFDSLLSIETGEANTVLLGCADELTNDSFHIQYRMGFWKRKPVHNLKLFDDPSPGTMAGEGASFFLLDTKKKPDTYAILEGTRMIPGTVSRDQMINIVTDFLAEYGYKTSDIDLLLAGFNGDPHSDERYTPVIERLFPRTALAGYKHLCGEYFTSTGFAVWLASRIIRDQKIPGIILRSKPPALTRNILIYNHFRGINHTLILLSKA